MDVVEVQETDLVEEVEEFLDAACRADYNTLSGILANGLSVDVVDGEHTTALQIAAAQGNLPMMKILLNRGASVDKCNDCGFSPLLHAARNGHAEAVELLIQFGANPKQTTFYGTTALSLAAAGGHLNVIVVLRKYECQTRRRAPSPLISAIAKQQYQLVIFFEFAGFVQHPCHDIFYELDAFHTAKQLNDTKMTALLRDLELQPLKPPPINRLASTFVEQEPAVSTLKNTTDIRCLIRDHRAALLDRVLDLGDDYIDLPKGTTPLMFAAIAGDILTARTLLLRNYDIDATCHGFTALMIAVVCGNDALTRYLIKQGAKQDTNGCNFSLLELASNSDGISPLTVQLIITGPVRKWCRIKHLPAVLRKIYKRRELRKSIYHQPIQLTKDAQQPSFLQKVIQNMGLKSDWIPEELFDALIWPDCSCIDFQLVNAPNGTKATLRRLRGERIMAKAEGEEQSRFVLDQCLLTNTKQEAGTIARPDVSKAFRNISCFLDSNQRLPFLYRNEVFQDVSLTPACPTDEFLSLTSISQLREKVGHQQQRCSTISKLQSNLFHFGPGSPKNISHSITSSPNDASVTEADLCQEYEQCQVPVIRSVAELCSSFRYEGTYRDLLNTRCSPDVCQKLVDQEVDCETFLMLSKAEFISLGISRSDAGILCYIQGLLKEQLDVSF